MNKKNEIIEYNITDAAIEKMESNYMHLKVANVDDKKNYGLVVEARKSVQKKIKAVEEKRVELKADSLEYGRRVDAEAKRIMSKLLPIKTHLKSQEDVIKKEKERIAAEKQKARNERHLTQVKQIIDAGANFNGIAYVYGENQITDAEIWNLFDEDAVTVAKWDCLLNDIKNWKKKKDFEEAEAVRLKKEEDDRQAKIAEENRIAQEKLDKQKAAQEAEAAKIKAAQAKLEADKRAEEKRKAQEKIDAEFKAEQIKQQKRNEELIEEAKKKAAADAKKKAEDEAKRKEKEKIAAEEKAKKAAVAKEKRRPDKEKLLRYPEALRAVASPELKTPESRHIMTEFWDKFELALKYLTTEAEKL